MGGTRPNGLHQRPGILKFPSTLQADLVGPFLDREHTTPLAVTAPEGKLENPKQWFHKSSVR
jgi:hypothetical protein